MQVNVSLRRNNSKEENEMQKRLESQLHEQYAVNNNANNTNYIALLTPLFMAFTGYAYVLYNYMTTYLPYGDIIMIYTTIAVLIVLLILHAVALEIGASQRSNQFVIDKIRRKAYNTADESDRIFPKGYISSGKNYFTFVQGIYNTFAKTCFYLYILFSVNLCFILNENKCIVYILLAFVLLMPLHRYCLFCKYKEKYDRGDTNSDNKECSCIIKILENLF